MANQQLVDYIKQQVQLGVQKDAIKSTLLSSGWPEAEVADALQSAAPAVAPAAQPQVTSDIFQPKTEVLKSEPKKAEVPFTAKIDSYQTAQPSVKMGGMAMATAASSPAASSGGGMKKWAMMGGGVLALILLAGGTWYFYSQSNMLADDKEAKIVENSELSRQLTALSQEKSNLQGQVNDLTEANNDMAVNLTFVQVGSGSPVTAKVKGTLKGDDKTPYTFTTSRGIVLSIKNYKDPKVNALLKPFLGNGITLGVTYVAGSREVMVTAVNDTVVPVETVAASSTAPAVTPAAASAPAATSTATTTPKQ
jgi:hypothetical protein